MSRITMHDLNTLVDRLNRVAGTPMTPYTTEQPYTPNAHNYHLGAAYGGYQLYQMCGGRALGGVRNVLPTGYTTKRKLFDSVHAFVTGIEIQRHAAAPTPTEN